MLTDMRCYTGTNETISFNIVQIKREIKCLALTMDGATRRVEF